MTTRGIPEVPMPSIRRITDKNGKTHEVSEFTEQHRTFLVDIREQILQLRKRQTVPDAPSNFKATGQGFNNLIQFTRSADADYYEVLHALTPSLMDPQLQVTDIGNSAIWTDHLGQPNITKFYWIRARKRTGASSLESGPVKATTVASNVAVPVPPPPPPGNIIVIDRSTGRRLYYTLGGARSLSHL
jgi:hypothetical protein